MCNSPRFELSKGRMASTDRRSAAHQFLASLPPIPCRDDFAVIVQSHFNQTGRAAEIGVFQGDFAKINLRRWRGEYFAIDAWAWRPDDDPHDKNFRRARDNDLNFEVARRAMAFAGSRVRQMRSLSLDAAKSFPDSHFDWIFLDALHTAQGLTRDLHAWWPKLRPGGLFSGDDYGDFNATRLMSAERYAALCA